ncbi:MAG: DUF2809 domain-containing protein [Flavobacteriaceae bacterium]|nr:DUF2809 domain-containing protein [Flavobacteriaceae bacterium]
MNRYFWIFIFLLVTEVSIAIFHFHPFIRGFVGDVLVIPLLYSFLKLFLKINNRNLLFGVLIFAFFIEFLQVFPIVKLLGLQHTMAAVILGTHFSVLDLLAYILGIIPVLLLENKLHYRKRKKNSH